jgi:hypothetical protein
MCHPVAYTMEYQIVVHTEERSFTKRGAGDVLNEATPQSDRRFDV